MSTAHFWIKERHNPQTGVYYVACGQMTAKDARRAEFCLYGTNYMHKFKSEADYENRLKQLRAKGERIQ